MRPAPLLRTLTTLALAAGLAVAALAAPATEWRVDVARPGTAGAQAAFDGVVEAVRQTVVAAQVAGAVVQLDARVGDRVKAGQVLLRLDARAAQQNAAAGDAQVQSARAALEMASRDFDRQRRLFETRFISQAALDQAQAQFKATQAQVEAQLAQAGAARTQTGFYVVRAPFDGVVSEVPVALGDMAMPGRPLLTLVDPTALRVTAAVPQSVAATLPAAARPRIEFPGLPPAQQWVQPVQALRLPTLDPGTHTVLIRADLPAGLPHLAPGMHARLWLPATDASASVRVQQAAVVRRAELTALYVLDAAGQPVLRQVRLGRAEGDTVEVLAGLTAGERVVLDPQAAARLSTASR